MGHIQRREREKGVVWRARYRGPDGREHSKTFDRKVDAQRFLAETETAQHRGGWVDPSRGDVSLAEWSREWLQTKRSIKPKTREGYASLLRSRILPALGDAPLNRLRRIDVEQWVSEMVADDLSASRIRQAANLLGAILDAAIKNRILTHNVARGVDLPRIQSTERRFISAEQVADLADAVPARYEALIYVLAYGGLRWGEAVALKRGRCHLLKRRIVVAESVTEVAGELVWGTPKTHQLGAVSLPSSVCEVLARHLAGRVPADPEALVFTSPDGETLRHPNFMRRIWHPAVEDAGIAGGLTPHELRHTCAALLIAEGADPKAVQTQLRHSSIQVTFDVYGHLFPGHMDDVMARLDATHQAAQRDDSSEPAAARPRQTRELPLWDAAG